jgi:hypothetical protein
MNRRQFLGRVGATAAVAPFVPLFDAHAQSGPKRLILLFTPHGTLYELWKPTGTETAFTLPPLLAPLARFQKKIVVLGGIAMPDKGVGAPHTKGLPLIYTASTLLEDMTFIRGDGSGGRYFGWNSGPSVDQFILQKTGAKTAYPSLELGVRSGGSHPASRMIFAEAKRPLGPEQNPYSFYDRLFTNKGDALRAERHSAIDSVRADLTALRTRLAAEDRPKLDAHLDAVRAVEKRLDVNNSQCLGMPMPMALGGTRLDPNAADNTPWTVDRQFELMTLAMACDATRFASLQFTVGDNDNSTYKWLGISDQGHHSLTHAPDTDMNAHAELQKIYTWYADRFAYLLERLDSVPEGNGTMLDNSLVVWGSELGKGNSHSFSNTPFVLAGGAGGALKTGRFLDYPKGTTHNRLLVSICNMFGVPVDKFGNTDPAAGPLPRLVG